MNSENAYLRASWSTFGQKLPWNGEFAKSNRGLFPIVAVVGLLIAEFKSHLHANRYPRVHDPTSGVTNATAIQLLDKDLPHHILMFAWPNYDLLYEGI